MKKFVAIVLLAAFLCALFVGACAATPASVQRKIEFPSGESSQENLANAMQKAKETDGDLLVKDIPTYAEEDLLFRTDGLFYLTRDACFYEMQCARQNDMGAILSAYPTDAVRKRDDASVYFIYDTDSNYRLYLMATSHNDYQTPTGFPIIVGKLLSYADYAELNIGDPIEKVEAIDPAAGLYKKEIAEVWDLDPKGAAAHAKDGYPCTSMHYLKDGILKIEYQMLDDESLIISDMVFRDDYTLVDAKGRLVNYKIEEEDLPA